jgi:hypothetical protein
MYEKNSWLRVTLYEKNYRGTLKVLGHLAIYTAVPDIM